MALIKYALCFVVRLLIHIKHLDGITIKLVNYTLSNKVQSNHKVLIMAIKIRILCKKYLHDLLMVCIIQFINQNKKIYNKSDF